MIEAKLDALLKEDFDSQTEKEELIIKKRLLKHRSELFVFLYDEAVSPTNNSSERALRPRVIHRKICNGNRSDVGKESYEVVASLIESFKKQGKNVFESLLDLFNSKTNYKAKFDVIENLNLSLSLINGER